MQASDWQSIVSGNAELKLSSAPVGDGQALRMDFDFKGGGGFVVARRALSRPMPEDYAVKFRLRGSGAVNNLELKLVDASGQNVWRHVQKGLRPPARWKQITIDSSAIEFAWGPSSSGHINTLGSMEIAIVAGEGGTGTLWIAGLEIEDRSPSEPPSAVASSALPGFEASGALQDSGWRPRPDDLARGLPSTRSSRAPSAAWSSNGGRPRRQAAFACVARTPAAAGARCIAPRGRAANAAMCTCPRSRRDSCVSS
jgi:hypothetical protein